MFCEVAYFDFLVAVGYGGGAIRDFFGTGKVCFFRDNVANVPAALKGVSKALPWLKCRRNWYSLGRIHPRLSCMVCRVSL